MKPLNAPSVLPIRIAQNRYAGLEHYNDAFFERLLRCGYEGHYLQMSPFDPLSGNYNGFWNNYHLIYLYDIVRGPQAAQYQDYIAEVCSRTEGYGLKTYFNLWEPRLPFTAWSQTPPEWRGRGGWMRNEKGNYSSFCWSVPEAVEYWKQMCHDAFDAMPGIAGCHLGVGDNEATLCDETCPRCRGEKWDIAYRDIFTTLNEVRQRRGKDFRITIYGWWMSDALIAESARVLDDPNTLLIGRSSQGISQMIDGEKIEGCVGDMTMVSGVCGEKTRRRKELADQLNIKLVDMVSWSHPIESWWIPAAPDPTFAWEKMNALREIGAHGWYDFDCGCIEPGSVGEMIALLTSAPDLSADEALEKVVQQIFPDAADRALEAYRLYAKGKTYFPIALNPEGFDALSLRVNGLGNVLFGPFLETDLTFLDLRIYPRNNFAPYSFMTEQTLPVYGRTLPRGTDILAEAFEAISQCPADSGLARVEQAAFEIHYRHFRAIRNYVAFAQARWDRVHGKVSEATYRKIARGIAEDELENTRALQAWMDRNPGVIGNPCWHLKGMLEDCWPGLDFSNGTLAPKIQSLEALIAGNQPDFSRAGNQHPLSQWNAPNAAYSSDWQTASIS